MATLTLQNKRDAHFLIIKTKKEVRNEINKVETGTRGVFESLYLVSYGEEDKYVDWDSPKLLKCFSGIEGEVNMLLLLLLRTLKMAVLKVDRKINVYRHACTRAEHHILT